MCFICESEWTAEVHEERHCRGVKAAKCYECGRAIAASEWQQQVHQQEYEACQICEDKYSDMYVHPDLATDAEHLAAIEEELAAHDCDFGETFDAIICRECSLILAAI